MIAAYHKRLTGADAEVRLAAARAWSMWEGSALSLLPDPARVAAFGEPHYAIAFARIECHYFVNRGFFDRDDQLIANAGMLRDIPGRHRPRPLRPLHAGLRSPGTCTAPGRRPISASSPTAATP